MRTARRADRATAEEVHGVLDDRCNCRDHRVSGRARPGKRDLGLGKSSNSSSAMARSGARAGRLGSSSARMSVARRNGERPALKSPRSIAARPAAARRSEVRGARRAPDRRDRAPGGTYAPARGGSRRSRRSRRGRGRDSQSAKRSCSSARGNRLRQRLVRGVTDQQMAEAEPLVLRERRRCRPDELLPHERREMRFDHGSHEIGGQHGHGAAMEDLALDRPTLHDDAHVAVRPSIRA